jgi:hypothetical protein
VTRSGPPPTFAIKPFRRIDEEFAGHTFPSPQAGDVQALSSIADAVILASYLE